MINSKKSWFKSLVVAVRSVSDMIGLKKPRIRRQFKNMIERVSLTSLLQIGMMALTWVFCVALTGCVSNKYVDRYEYVLQMPEKSKKVVATSKSCSVFVNHVVATAPFDQLDFLYRVSPKQYLVDYYHSFLSDPTTQLDEILITNLRDKVDLNLYVTEESSYKNRLQLKLTELYADYRIRNNPRAVIAMHLILTTQVKNKTVILFDQVLKESVELRAKNTESLLNGWNIGIQEIIMRIAEILNKQIKC